MLARVWNGSRTVPKQAAANKASLGNAAANQAACIALASAGAETFVIRDRFPADRVTFKQLATQTALDMLRQLIRAERQRIGLRAHGTKPEPRARHVLE